MQMEEIHSFLSNIEEDQCRDTFIFREGANNASSIKLMAGAIRSPIRLIPYALKFLQAYSQDDVKLSKAQVYRCIRAFRYPDWKFDKLYQVVLWKPFDGLRLMEKVGDPIPDTDQEQLLPGNYGWFKSPGTWFLVLY